MPGVETTQFHEYIAVVISGLAFCLAGLSLYVNNKHRKEDKTEAKALRVEDRAETAEIRDQIEAEAEKAEKEVKRREAFSIRNDAIDNIHRCVDIETGFAWKRVYGERVNGEYQRIVQDTMKVSRGIYEEIEAAEKAGGIAELDLIHMRAGVERMGGSLIQIKTREFEAPLGQQRDQTKPSE